MRSRQAPAGPKRARDRRRTWPGCDSQAPAAKLRTPRPATLPAPRAGPARLAPFPFSTRAALDRRAPSACSRRMRRTPDNLRPRALPTGTEFRVEMPTLPAGCRSGAPKYGPYRRARAHPPGRQRYARASIPDQWPFRRRRYRRRPAPSSRPRTARRYAEPRNSRGQISRGPSRPCWAAGYRGPRGW